MKINFDTVFWFVVYSLWLFGLGVAIPSMGLSNLCQHPELFTPEKTETGRQTVIVAFCFSILTCIAFWIFVKGDKKND